MDEMNGKKATGILIGGILWVVIGAIWISSIPIMTECKFSIWNMSGCFDFVPRLKNPHELFMTFGGPVIFTILGILITLMAIGFLYFTISFNRRYRRMYHKKEKKYNEERNDK